MESNTRITGSAPIPGFYGKYIPAGLGMEKGAQEPHCLYFCICQCFAFGLGFLFCFVLWGFLSSDNKSVQATHIVLSPHLLVFPFTEGDEPVPGTSHLVPCERHP